MALLWGMQGSMTLMTISSINSEELTVVDLIIY